MTLPVLVINRDRDTERWDACRAAAAALGVDPHRIPAEDAHAPDFLFHAHADLIGDHFWGRDTIKPGAVGCFLSHRKAWRHVVDAGLPAALILEDDADLTVPPDRAADALATADLVFANDRLAGWAAATDAGAGAVSLDGVIARVAAAGGPKALGLRPAPGADAYVVTAAGAARLLQATGRLRIVCGVDWAMIWSALRDPPAAGIPELEILARTASRPAAPLAAAVLVQPVARLRKGPSVLRHSVEVPVADLVRRG